MENSTREGRNKIKSKKDDHKNNSFDFPRTITKKNKRKDKIKIKMKRAYKRNNLFS